jgi:hypothetical protein
MYRWGSNVSGHLVPLRVCLIPWHPLVGHVTKNKGRVSMGFQPLHLVQNRDRQLPLFRTYRLWHKFRTNKMRCVTMPQLLMRVAFASSYSVGAHIHEEMIIFKIKFCRTGWWSDIVYILIREVLGSNLGQDTGLSCLSCFPQSLGSNMYLGYATVAYFQILSSSSVILRFDAV